ncbi:hypothetical protein ACH4C6_27820 [Streptomyces sp. NPDC017943]|uniref:hypothetical protein n=1 Tax=Streptomyces sp. NPDC017943 TaxID=3365019 RepID=UPI00379D7600
MTDMTRRPGDHTPHTPDAPHTPAPDARGETAPAAGHVPADTGSGTAHGTGIPAGDPRLADADRATEAGRVAAQGTDPHGTATPGNATHDTGLHGTATPGNATHDTGLHGTATPGTGVQGTGTHGTGVHDTKILGTGTRGGDAAPGGTHGTDADHATTTGTHQHGVHGDGVHGHGTGRDAGRAGGAADAHLFPHDASDKLGERLRHAVAGFVDGPRASVEEADQVLEEITARFTEVVTERRRTLRRSWQTAESGGDKSVSAADTEQLRLALKDYREIAERLLHV